MKTFRTLMTGAAAAVALVVLGGCAPVDPAPSLTTSTTSTTTYQHCLTVRATIETAIEAYAVGEMGGLYPETLEPVAAMYLKPGTSLSEWTYTGLGRTYTLTGPC